MAVIEYSLKHGISTVFHTYMSPEDHRIPLGYSFEIQQNATESHGLPLDCEPMRMREASSWSWIVAQFLDVVNPKRFDEAFPPLFTIGVQKIALQYLKIQDSFKCQSDGKTSNTIPIFRRMLRKSRSC